VKVLGFFFWFKVLNRRIKCEAFFGVLLLFLVKILASSLLYLLVYGKCIFGLFCVLGF
jgi:hypothetical protein